MRGAERPTVRRAVARPWRDRRARPPPARRHRRGPLVPQCGPRPVPVAAENGRPVIDKAHGPARAADPPLAAAGRIRVLDAQVANQIAAGEVIERPASVVKELVENCLDAHATRVEVHVERGGEALIRVVDDGWGIARDDLRTAFLPHATSKLREVGDLESIATLGFRGEALASIGAISRASILSRVRGEDSGFLVENRGGEIAGPRAAGAAEGTEVCVRDLFFNTPARAKFLRTVRTEIGHIEDLVREFALAFPEVAFLLTHDGSELLRTTGGESRLDRLRRLFGRETADRLLPVSGDLACGRFEGFLSPPDLSRPHARDLHFFLNGRTIRDKILHRIVRDAYRDALHPGRYPVLFLFLDVDPAEVDVNVHPTKAEVRWRDPRLLHSGVSPVLSRALRAGDRSLTLAAGAPDEAQERREAVRGAVHDFLSRQERLSSGSPPPFGAPGCVGGAPREEVAPGATAAFSVFQVHDSYLVCEVEDGIAIIDQHALHERVWYDRILARLMEGGVEAQRLLVPEQVELASEEIGLLEEHRDLLRRCGLEWSPFGGGSVALETIPAVIPRGKAVDLLRDLLDLLRGRGGDARALEPRLLFHDVADTMACKAAIRFGDRLSREEAAALVQQSGALDRAFVCPHGRPTVLRLTLPELARRFGRSAPKGTVQAPGAT